MDEFTVYTIPGSPYARAVFVALEEKDLPYRLIPLAPGATKAAEHLARHPFGRMPVIDHGGFSLYETQAIVRYIDRIQPRPSLTPAEPRAAARMDQLMGINDWYLFQGVSTVIAFQRVVGPRLLGLTPDEESIAEAMPRARLVFEVLGSLLGEQSWFVGDSPTLADVMLAPQIDFFSQTPEWQTLTAPHGNLVSWIERMNERPSMQATTWERMAALASAA